MNTFHDISEVAKDKNTFVTIGTFDGLHLGHRNIIDLLISKADEENGRTFVMTFDPHPRTVVSDSFEKNILTTTSEKVELFGKSGIDNLLIINFNRKFSSQDYREFIVNYLVEGTGVSHVVIGHDHKFGKDRSGNEARLRELGKEFGFEVSVVGEVQIDGETVSSTTIRKLLKDGQVNRASRLLGRNYSLSGIVVKGVRRGRLLGFPTANIQPAGEEKLIPKNGVYVVSCRFEENEAYGLMNIGVRPTFEEKGAVTFEVHLLDYSGGLYGKKLRIEFLKRLRDEKKFASGEELIYQINRDKQEALRFLSKLV